VLLLKARQHADVCGVLLNTADAELVCVEPDDPFWGAGDAGGRNELGRALMRVRDVLRDELEDARDEAEGR
jgi:predicted NAD-dependent protein-ADP-ribosyltransferase YbiA (DUF1768 family)